MNSVAPIEINLFLSLQRLCEIYFVIFVDKKFDRVAELTKIKLNEEFKGQRTRKHRKLFFFFEFLINEYIIIK